MKNVPLFKAEDLPPRARYEKLFENLPSLPDLSKATGRPPFSRDAILRALIYKNLRGLPSLTDLVFELENNPVMAEVLGFCPGRPAPSKERFSQFLRTLSHVDLQAVRLTLVRCLIQEGVTNVVHANGRRHASVTSNPGSSSGENKNAACTAASSGTIVSTQRAAFNGVASRPGKTTANPTNTALAATGHQPNRRRLIRHDQPRG